MIDSIRLKNFKCFRDETIRLGGLTILSGLNSSGKSSVIQAVLALRQQFERDSESLWRGSLADLGSFQDVLHIGATDGIVKIEASLCGGSATVSLQDGWQDPSKENGESVINRIQERWLFADVFYLSADRIGPRPILSYSKEGHSSGTPLGIRGEHVLWYLDRFGKSRVGEPVKHPNTPNKTLEAQTNAWLGVISPGTSLRVKTIPEADSAVAEFRFARPDDVPGSPFGAGNVGFGLSHVLPSVVALLAPRRDPAADSAPLVIIEHPEAHLHPTGQTSLAELAARSARNGAQVILETHSEHVLNGVRLAVLDGILPPDQVAIHYFEQVGLETQVTSPSIFSNGRLDKWPEGFFDQHERNLSRLLSHAVTIGN